MELRKLKTFQVVAEELNLTKAAKKLTYSQPTITLQIQSLEKELNHTLFTRVGKKTMLTTAGIKLKSHVDELFRLIDKMEKEMEELRDPSGVLTIAASEYYCQMHLATLIKEYADEYPEVKVSLLPLNSIHAIQSVRDEVADIAVIASECDDVHLEKTFLEEEQAYVVVSTKIGQSLSFQDIISEHAFISYNEDCSFSKIIAHYFQVSGHRPQSKITVGGSDEMIKRAVLNGTGYAILGENVIKQEIADGTITILDRVPNAIITSAINVKTRSEEPNIMTFCKFLKNRWDAGTGLVSHQS
ncbi:LysR family transcriptional regulator [Rossellomorea aquimaris]|uniref:LysR family transcriptional regulator n=1 Tax=Rossellomorea aquimaris TaxID=189382 RepID=UPI001CD21FC8|nr:LysR family transcriptional regulator [Rossellomorea aquimaris]MCA1055861.1 LysR family transcriptional regulator [Rossellomorea aquimaris]